MTACATPATPAEWEILLSCARLAVHGRAPRERAARGVDWAHLVELADLHGLVPHLHRLLGDRDAAPAEIRARLAAQAAQIARHNLHLTGELHRVLEALGAAGIDALCFKGPALAALLYGAVGLRQFTDLDLLVRREQAQQALDLVRGLGYRDVVLGQGLDAPVLPEARLHHDGRRVAVEIHWGLVKPITGISPTLGGCWARTDTLAVAGRPARVLGREDRVLLLVTHGASHGWGRLGWLCDLGRLIAIDAGIDWSVVGARARALHCERMLYLGLALCRELFAVPVPAALAGRSRRDRVVSPLARELIRRCKDGPGAMPSRLLPLRVRERLRDQVGMTARTLFQPTPWDHDFWRLPPWAAPAAGALRPLRLFLRLGLAPLLDRAGVPLPPALDPAVLPHLARAHEAKKTAP